MQKELPSVVIMPGWALQTVIKRGKLADVCDFRKIRQWFSTDQLVALHAFSKYPFPELFRLGINDFTTALSYVWLRLHQRADMSTPNDADMAHFDAIVYLVDGKEKTTNAPSTHAIKMMDEYIYGYLRDTANDALDVSQSYSVYHAGDNLIVVALNQGIASAALLNRRQEVVLSIMRDILKIYYALAYTPDVHKSACFGQYLTELSQIVAVSKKH